MHLLWNVRAPVDGVFGLGPYPIRDECHAPMPAYIQPLQVIPSEVLIFFLVSAAAAAWVLNDARARFPRGPGEGWVWALGTLVGAGPIFLPLYLIAARPIGDVAPCPSCGRGTLSHRASCLHCGRAIAFESFPVTWGLGEVIGISAVFMISLPVIAQAVGVHEIPTLADVSLFALVQNAVFVGLVWYVVRVRYRRPLTSVGVRTDRWLMLSVVGALIGAATIPLSTAAEGLAVWIIGLVLGAQRAQAMAAAEHASDVLTAILQGRLAPAELAWIVILVCVLVPVGEEVFFRGFVFRTLRRWGLPAATLVSALYFGAVHQQIVHFLPIMLLGAVLALLLERTGSLVPGIVVHGVNNLVAVLAVLYGWNI